LVFFVIIISIVLIPILLSNIQIKNIDVELEFNANNAYKFVEDQINLNLTHYRIPGTQGREDCAKYFISKFQEIDLDFNYILHNFTISSVECQNILFKLNENHSNIMILGAHYDSRARATKDSTNPDLPVPGANDGASGSAVLVELAKVLYNKLADLTVQLWFLFFDAEDQGFDRSYGISGWDWCEGSTQFVHDIASFHNSSKENFECMVLLDMVGGDNLKFIKEQYSTSSLLNEIFEIGTQLGYSEQFPKNALSSSIIDDHVAFSNYGIPSADLIINFWNNPNWPYHHTVNDDIIHISNYSLEVTGKTVEQFIYNNYLDVPNNNYRGNYPWRNDINLPDTEILILLLIIASILGIIAVIYLSLKKIFRSNH